MSPTRHFGALSHRESKSLQILGQERTILIYFSFVAFVRRSVSTLPNLWAGRLTKLAQNYIITTYIAEFISTLTNITYCVSAFTSNHYLSSCTLFRAYHAR